MLHSPFILCLLSFQRSSPSVSLRPAIKSLGEGKVPRRKVKQEGTLYVAFGALSHINCQKQVLTNIVTLWSCEGTIFTVFD